MERTYRKPGGRAGLGALTALAVLLAGTGTSIASDASEPLAIKTMAKKEPLVVGAGYRSPAEAKRVRVLQRALDKLGWAPGKVDGLLGPLTETAVLRFQAATGLAIDGVVGPATWKTLAQAHSGGLRRGAGYASPGGSARVSALQRRLRARGLNPGPVDGRYGPSTETAVARLQRAAGIKASGALDSLTRRVLTRRLAKSGRPVRDSKPSVPPRLLQSVSITPLAAQAAGSTVDLYLACALAAVALLIGAIGGAVVGRKRALSASTHRPVLREPERTLELQPSAERKDHRETEGPVRAVGYVSVPKANGDDAGALERQASAIAGFCERRGWELLHVVRDVENGHPKGLERPGLLYALERLAEGEASCLIVSQLERLSRSASDLGRILEWIDDRDGRLVAIDLRLDTGSAQGRLTGRALVEVAEWEGRRIADQTRKGLAAARARRESTGRPAVADRPALKDRIVRMRNDGMTLQAIADHLNREGIPTLRGGSQWRPSSVQSAAGYRRPKGKQLKERSQEDRL